MNQEAFKQHAQAFVAEMLAVMAAKNPDYSAGTPDALNDYYSAARRAGIAPRQAWFVLMTKHVHAIERYAKTGQLSSEGIHGRLIDLANYAILGDALAAEEEEAAAGGEAGS
jgi:hypothetical protein